jgi:hypothetical protein
MAIPGRSSLTVWDRQAQGKTNLGRAIRREKQVAAMCARNVAGDRQAQTGSFGFSREERFEDQTSFRRRNRSSNVFNFNLYLAIMFTGAHGYGGSGRRRIDRIQG